MGNKNIPEVMYRVLVIAEDENSSWNYSPITTEDFSKLELDKTYCSWLNIKNRGIKTKIPKEVNGSKLEVEAIISEVHKQVGCYDKKKRGYKWVDEDDRGNYKDFGIHLS